MWRVRLDTSRYYGLHFCHQRIALADLPQLSIGKDGLSCENYLILPTHTRPSLVLNQKHHMLLHNAQCNIFELRVLLPAAHETSFTVFDASDAQLYNGLHTIFFSQPLPVLIVQIGKHFGQESSPFNVKLAIENSVLQRHSFDAALP